jgi:phage terminase small subunit
VGRQGNDKYPGDRRARFVQEYLIDLDITAAAKRAGYSEGTAKTAIYKVLQDPRVKKMIEDGMAEKKARLGVKADRLIRELELIVFADIGETTHTDGTVKTLAEMTESVRRALGTYETRETEAGRVRRVQLESKLKAMELYARLGGLLTDKVEHSTDGSFAEMLKAARERADKG